MQNFDKIFESFLGTSHADDAFLVIENPFINPRTTEKDRAMQKHLLNLWVSVAANGYTKFLKIMNVA